MARAALRPLPWWRRAQLGLGGLMQPFPAAAFATVVLASTIGLMWRGEVPAEAMPGVSAEHSPAPLTPEVRELAKAPAASTSTSTSTPTPAPTPLRARTVPAAPVTTPAPPSHRPAPTPAVQVTTEPPPIAPAQAAPPAPTVMTERSEAKAAVALGGAAAPIPAVRSDATPMLARRAAGPVPAFNPMTTVLSSLRPTDPRQAALQDLQQASQGRWQRDDAPHTGTPNAIDFSDAQGRALGRLRLDEHTAWWFAADGSTWRAELPAATLSALRTRLGKGG